MGDFVNGVITGFVILAALMLVAWVMMDHRNAKGEAVQALRALRLGGEDAVGDAFGLGPWMVRRGGEK